MMVGWPIVVGDRWGLNDETDFGSGKDLRPVRVGLCCRRQHALDALHQALEAEGNRRALNTGLMAADLRFFGRHGDDVRHLGVVHAVAGLRSF